MAGTGSAQTRRTFALRIGAGVAVAVLILLLSICVGAVAVSADGTVWHVDGVTGQDIVTCGTTITPCETISYTLNSRAASGDTVRVAQGVYTENLSVDQPIALEGGYEAGGWTRDLSGHETVVDGSSSRTVPGDWDGSGVHCSIVISDTGMYKMWYRGYGLKERALGLTTSVDGVTWVKSPSNPVMTPTVDWEEGDVGHPHVIKDGATYKMWYGPDVKIGYAWSSDGVAWTKYASNPVMQGTPGAWNEKIGAPFVIKMGPSDYHMWYHSRDTQYAIGYATSANGIDWIKRATPVLTVGPAGAWDDEKVADPNVLFDGATYHMWYSGENGDAIRIGYATSPDGITWTKYAGNPVLARGAPGDWDEFGVGEGNVLYDGSQYRMWFSGWQDGWSHSQRGYATSPDGIVWTKHAGNPVLTPGAPGAWGQPVVRLGHGSDGSLLDGFTIRNGEAEFGGGVFINSGGATVRNCVVISNTAYNWGGGIGVAWGERAVVQANQILSNTAQDWFGSGVAIVSAEALVDGNLIAHNTSTSSLWGVGTIGISMDGPSRPVTVTNNLVIDNEDNGVRIAEGVSNLRVVNNTIASNRNDGIMAWAETTISLVRNNIVAFNGGCGIAGAGGATFQTVDHNNVWQNRGGVDNYCDYGGAAVPPAPGAGSLSTSPLFVDAANGDYHLQAGSPCIDRGTNAGAPAADFDGERRPSAITDIGADEFQWPWQYHMSIMARGAVR